MFPNEFLHSFIYKNNLKRETMYYLKKIMRLTALLMLCNLLSSQANVFAQVVAVSGTVTDHAGELMPGVTIAVKGTTSGVVSGLDGKYSIQAPSGNAVLVFSFIGYATQEIRVGNRTTLDVSLSEDVQVIQEVVVIGYGTLDKKQVTSSITSISARDLPAGVGGATITNAMKGKVSSLVVQETPSPNSETTLQLRGMASVNTSRAPLVVIDGMPGGDIRSVVQEDIQSIDVLKDASAGAIYGTRATGGVILITTRQAQEGKVKLSYTGEVIFKQDFGRPDVMNAKDYLKYKPDAKNYGQDVDWWREGMADNPTSQRHVITLQGGSSNARIYATTMYEDNRGVLMGDDRIDYGGRINANFKTLDGWLDINTHIDYRQANRSQSKPSVTNLIGNNPTRSPYDPNSQTGYNIWTGELNDFNTIGDAALTVDNGTDKWFRPDVEFKLNILPVQGLSYNQTMGYENRQWEYHYYRSMYATEELTTTRKGTAELKFSKTELFNADGYLSFVRQLGEHYINTVGGYSYFEQNDEFFRLKNYGFTNDLVQMWDIGKGINLNNPDVTTKAEMESSKGVTQRLLAFFARANYSYKDTYLAAASFRREGSSKFSANKRWGNFYSLNAGWRISNEDFMKNIAWINDLKIRGGYGVTGNEGFSADYAATMYGSDTYWQLPTGEWAYSYGVTKNINPDLGWEEKHEWNVGADYSFFNNRIYGKLDIYRRNVKGLIYEVKVPQPPYTEQTMYKNIGTLVNRGWEFEIGGDVVRSKDWNYNTSINLSHNSTTVGSLWGNNTYYEAADLGWAGNIHRIQENTKVGSFYLYRYAGVDNNGEFLTYNKAGDVIVAVTDKKDEDKVYMGNYMPALTAGWTHNLTYKNWSLSTTLTSWIDFDIYNHVQHSIGTQGGSVLNMMKSAYEKNGHITGQVLACDYYLEDGTFLKIQNINIGYMFNAKKYLKVMESAKLYLTLNNVYTFTRYSGLNPEVDITGWENGVERNDIYPQTRTFALGLQLNF
jgi:TonB-linked SusC/RagA family outer membrane protein